MAMGSLASDEEARALRNVFGVTVRFVTFYDSDADASQFAQAIGRDADGEALREVGSNDVAWTARHNGPSLAEMVQDRGHTVTFFLEVPELPLRVLSYPQDAGPGVVIAGDTDPWVEVAGTPFDWHREPRLAPVPGNDCGTCGSSPVRGMLEAMNSPTGIQRCDECQVFSGDLEAAQAGADLVGGQVRFYVEPCA